jgi:uncharacterized protein YjaG (DUF416 family)
MIDWKDHEVWLLKKLGQLEEWKRVAFAAACAGRALPVYIAHVERLDEDRRACTEVEQVKLALEFVWTNLTNIDQNASEAQSYIKILEQIIVEREEDSLPAVPFDSEALYAAYSINDSLHTYLNGNLENTVRAATSNYNILGYYFSETRCDTNDERSPPDMRAADVHPIESILARPREELLRFRIHPLVQAELGRQQQDVMRLDAVNATMSDAFVRSFREASTNMAVLPSYLLAGSA